MKAFLLSLLLMVAPAALAQEVLVPEESMRDAWSEEQPQFDSLSSDYGNSYGEDGYGYSNLERRDRLERRSPPDNSRNRDETGDSVYDGTYDRDLR